MNTLMRSPHAIQYAMTVRSYDEAEDQFECLVVQQGSVALPECSWECKVPAFLLPILAPDVCQAVGDDESEDSAGLPYGLCGKSFTVTATA